MSKWLKLPQNLNSIKNFFSPKTEKRKPLFAIVNEKKKKSEKIKFNPNYQQNQQFSSESSLKENESTVSTTTLINSAQEINRIHNAQTYTSTNSSNTKILDADTSHIMHEWTEFGHTIYPEFFYQYAAITGITIDEKRKNLKELVFHFYNYRENMEKKRDEIDQLCLAMGKSKSITESLKKSFQASIYSVDRGLLLYMVFRMCISTSEVGITRQLWNKFVPLISESLPSNRLIGFHNEVSKHSSLSFTSGLPLLRLMRSYGLLFKHPEDIILFLTTSFELQDTDTIQLFRNEFFSNAYFHSLNTNINTKQVDNQKSTLIMRDIEIYLYILGNVYMLSSEFGYSEVLEIWNYFLQNQINIIDDRIFSEICSIICDAVFKMNFHPKQTYNLIIQILDILQKRNITPSAELIKILLKHDPKVNLWKSDYLQEIWASLKKIETKEENSEISIDFKKYREILEEHLFQKVYHKFPKAGVPYMTQDGRESWIINQIKIEDSSQLPKLLELVAWMNLIYSQEPSELLLNTFLDQISRISTNHEKLSFIIQLSSSFPGSKLSNAFLYRALKEYFMLTQDDLSKINTDIL